MRYLIFVAFVFSAFSAFSQYKVLMLNGDTVPLRNIKYNDMGTALTFHNRDREVVEIDLDQIFSISDTTGKETIIYKPDTLKDDYMNVEQMRFYIKGMNVAKDQYKCKWCFSGGIVLGVASPFIAPVIGLNIFYSPLIPAAASSGIGFTGASKDYIMQKNPELAKSEHFIQGYKDVSGQKRMKSTILGSGLGLVVGVLTSIIIYQAGK